MPSQSFTVEVHGLDALRRRLDSGRILGPVKQEMIREASEQALKTAQTEFKGRAGTGGIARTVKEQSEQGGLVRRIDVPGAVARKALSIETGRPPGKNVPYATLTAWAKRAGLPTDRASVKAIRAGIKERGTQGTRAMEKASREADKTLKAKQPATERRIERDFNG